MYPTALREYPDYMLPNPRQPVHWLQSPKVDYAFLFLIVIVAAAIRLTGLFHGTGHHPDERHMVMVTEALSRNGMNPKSFAYGSFSFYAAWFAASGLNVVWRLFGGQEGILGRWGINEPMSYDGLFVAGRLFCIFMGTLAVPLIYILARKLWNNSAIGLLSALLLTLNVFHIQLSRFFTSDVTLTTVSLAAVIALVIFYQRQTYVSAIGFGILLGLATATKISSAFLAAPLGVAMTLAAIDKLGFKRTLISGAISAGVLTIISTAVLAVWYYLTSSDAPWVVWDYPLLPEALLIPTAGVIFLITALIEQFREPLWAKAYAALAIGVVIFILAQPFGILDFETFSRHTNEQTSMVRGLWRPPFTIQYEHTMPYFYHLKQMLWYTMGVPVFTLAIVGTLVSLARVTTSSIDLITRGNSTTHRELAELIPLTFLLVFFLTTAQFQVKFPRYLLPLYPVFLTFAAALFGRMLGKPDHAIIRAA